MADCDKESSVSGLASSFEKGAADLEKSPNAVGGIAARFENASKEPENGPSAKISSLASAFDGPPPTGKPSKLPTSPAKPRPSLHSQRTAVRENSADDPNAGGSNFSQAISRFASGGADGAAPADASRLEDSGAMFKNASSAFAQREKDYAPGEQSKVSAFASRFEKPPDATESALVTSVASRFENSSPKEVPVLRKAISRSQEPARPASPQSSIQEGKSGGVGAAAAIFEKNQSQAGSEKKTEGEDLPGRFQKATALFEGHRTPAKDENEGGESGAQRFADASKLFGGSD